uniref:Uncharacterized protein n=1 Tax=Knipowitschia caucasica TaxID=637954 RepID=A0AAV2KH12_KNICA
MDGAPSVARLTARDQSTPTLSNAAATEPKMSSAVVVSIIGTNSRNSSVTVNVSSTPRINMASWATSVMSVLFRDYQPGPGAGFRTAPENLIFVTLEARGKHLSAMLVWADDMALTYSHRSFGCGLNVWRRSSKHHWTGLIEAQQGEGGGCRERPGLRSIHHMRQCSLFDAETCGGDGGDTGKEKRPIVRLFLAPCYSLWAVGLPRGQSSARRRMKAAVRVRVGGFCRGADWDEISALSGG